MDARRSPETAATTADTTTTTAETPAPAAAKRTTTDASKAATLFNRLQGIDAEEQAELAVSPQDIRAKFEDRRAKELAKAPEAVRNLVVKMRATT